MGEARKFRVVAALAASLLWLGSCAGPRDAQQQQQAQAPVVVGALPVESIRLFSFTYGQIVDKYVEPVSLASLTSSGLDNLKKIDANFAVLRNGDKLEARNHGALIETFDTPKSNDARRWAELTVATINTARAASPQLRDATSESIYRTVFEGATQTLDPYTRYLDPESAADQRADREGFGGIGVMLEMLDTEVPEPRVSSVMADSPAARSGLMVDDKIVLVDNQPTAGLQLRDIVRRLRGPVGRPVTIAIRRGAEANTRPITIARSLIVPQSITYRREGDIAYIRIASFNQATTENLNDALRKALREIGPKINGVILDLRGNLGGLLDQAVSVSEVFLPDGPIVSTRGRYKASDQISESHGGGLGSRVPLVVLINGNSASASEIVAAALQDNGRAVLVGTTSYGKGSVQSVIPLPNDGELRLTWARFYAPTGYPLQGLGVTPTICTSGRSDSAAAIIASARDGRMITAEAMATWRAADHTKADQLKELRQHCAPDVLENAVDLDVARGLLTDRSLYARAVRVTHQTANEAAR